MIFDDPKFYVSERCLRRLDIADVINGRVDVLSDWRHRLDRLVIEEAVPALFSQTYITWLESDIPHITPPSSLLC